MEVGPYNTLLMRTPGIPRRELLGRTAALAGAAAAAGCAASAQDRPAAEPFVYCLNTSTISGQKPTFPEVVDIAAKAGYRGIEPWLNEIDRYVKSGGTLKDAARRLRDAGLAVESAIGFAEWIVEDDARRARGLETMKRDMEVVAQIGGTRIAAPPAGANGADAPLLDLRKVAERYRAILELGDQTGVVPQVEVWGFSKNLQRLSDAVFVALEARHPKACVLADVYHLYKGGSDHGGLRLLSGASMHAIHMNDYPADPPRETIGDAHRVYPGDGVAPVTQVLRDLRAIGFRGALSLELFNRDYWKQDAATVARTGIEKMRAAVAKALT
jgi:sugar phosphate isomerase/epimerase